MRYALLLTYFLLFKKGEDSRLFTVIRSFTCVYMVSKCELLWPTEDSQIAKIWRWIMVRLSMRYPEYLLRILLK